MKMYAQGRNSKRLPPAATTLTLMLVLTTSMSGSTPGLTSSLHIMPVSAFSFTPVTNRATANTKQLMQLAAPKRTICNAKLNKIASTFDLDEILSNEKEFEAADGSGDDETGPYPKGRRRNKKSNKNDEKKRKMKEELKQQKLEKQKLKQRMKQQLSSSGTNNENNSLQADANNGHSDDSISDGKLDIDYENLIQNIDFHAYEIPPPLNGKRIDAALVELLNKDDDDKSSDATSNSVSISRSQCGTLLSNECVFVVPPEEANEFRSAWQAHLKGMNSDDNEESSSTALVPYSLIEKHGSSIQRKSHPLEPSSFLVYPSRKSLLSTSSSSTLLSNFIPPTEIIAQNIPFDILYEDEHMIVINKQAGMVVHPAAGNWDGTMVNALAYYLMNESPFGAGEFFTDDAEEEEGNTPDSNIDAANNNDADVNQNDAVTNSISTLRPGIVHRLDKGTTGVLVVAKTSSSLATLSEAFAERRVKKQYLAVTIGNPGEDQWINKPIGRHPTHRQRMRVVPDPSSSMADRGQARLTGPKSAAAMKQGRPALSHIHTIHYDGKLSVVQVKIATGRTHQIRVHLQDHGTPVYGDDVYGLSDWNKALSSRKGILRPLLHAQRLEIDHPVTGENMVFEAKVADDMMGVIKTIWPAGEKLEIL